MVAPELIREHPLVEQILAEHRGHGGPDERSWQGYHAHVYRVLNLARTLAPQSPDRDEKLAIAGAFHDLVAFRTLDYLAPSIAAQDAWLARTGRSAWADELALVVAEHHKLTPYRRAHAPLVEAFRRADLADLSQGLLHPGLSRAYVKAVRSAFDAGPFFARVVAPGLARRIVRHPRDPLPLMRARRALTRSGHEGADG
ncbi:MAG: Enoyl-CoA hydratase [uncultured Solirubrobacteraceae bacterium]|uniref:Enoyl-CoA hydratase n=1 Tax=uncultured Solirubrobacteraceae bacterium TaxID=1162706 RepID=A0A6J4RWT3_9ACTN|nr:MAG: Enoyl-CoA hydratase [uncultured Solirubrobacteraceae bacterium]